MPSLLKMPQEGMGGLTPKPIKLIKASVAMAKGILSVAKTMMGPRLFGSKWLRMILNGD